jgi:hypothetical protein
MLVGIRHPVGLAAVSLAAIALLVLLFQQLAYPGGAAVRGDEKVDRILADSAPLIVSDLAGFQERRRRQGRGYALDTDRLIAAWTRQFRAKDRRQMREWTRYHGLEASATRSAFVIEALSAPGRTGWYRLTVDRGAHAITARCGGDPSPGCHSGRWRIEKYGEVRGYLLGR